jgi:Domain of unknown function (DUF1929)
MIATRSLRTWILGAALGAASLRCGGDTGPQDVQPASLAMVSGNGQNGPVGVALPDSLVVIVKDSQGQPLKGVAVDWSANGSVSSSSVTSGADGHAAVRWTLGNTAGAQSASATAGDLPAVAFTATAEAPVPLAIVVQPPDSALDKEVLAPDRQPVLLVRDAQGALANGVTVTAAIKSGGGTLEGVTSAVSGADGKAAFADLGINGTGSHTLEFTAGSNSVTSSSIDVSALPPEATSGSWGPLVPWDIVPLHMHLLPNGKILGWGKYDNGATGTMGGRPRLWDPASGDPLSTAQMVQVDTMLFCSGHAFMPDGKLMVSGGHKDDDKGIDVTNIFDPGSGSFTSGPKMAFGRWYPTVTELPDGRMLTMAGRDSAGNVVTIPEIWESDHWVKLPGAVDTVIPYYPRNFVDPKNGLIFMAGERIKSRWFDVDGSTGGQRGHWIDGPSHLYQKNRDYGTAVMYDAGKILYAGGGGDPNWPTPDPRASAPTATAEIIDLITPSGSPHWTNIAPMHFARRHLNSTVLPDGTVLVTGGTSGGGFVDINTGDAVKTAELWDPKHPTQWTQLAANSVMRVYHSVSLLLPDGTVLHGASGNALAAQPGGGSVPVPDQKNHEIFSPPYLFKGARPTITSAPATVGIGDNFTVETPNAAQVTDVRWIRIGSVTHAFDAGQRANTLSFTATSTGVSVTAPADHNLAPPGHYMLFILNRNGVPSKGKIIQLQ